MNDLLKFVGPCPTCSNRFKDGEIAAVNQSDTVTLVHADCSSCQSSVFMTLVRGQAGTVTNVAVLTDLTKKDFEKFSSLKAITLDDVLELHKALKSK